MKNAFVKSLSKSTTHCFSKSRLTQIQLIKGIGVEGDVHAGEKVKHRSRVAKDPTQPNLRQVHLMHSELFLELRQKGFTVLPGQLGENITTEGIQLLELPRDTILKIGSSVQIKITGLRNPCSQLNDFQEGLMQAVLDKDDHGNLIRKAGIMGVVLEGGKIEINDRIEIVIPPKPHFVLERV